MGFDNKKIRPLSLLLVSNKQGQYLVVKGFDSKKQEEFYRLVGGAIEFGETGKEALIREIKEELATDVDNINLLGVFENIFEFEGEKGHEIVFVYRADFKDDKIYQLEKLPILDSKRGQYCYWVDKEKLLDSKLYPDGIKEYVL